MNIETVGDFESYQPEMPARFQSPTGEVMEISFYRRVEDGRDWYSLIHGEAPEVHAEEGVLYATALPLRWPEGHYLLSIPHAEPDRLLLGPVKVVKITGYTGTKPETDIGSMFWDGATSDLIPQPKVGE